MKRWMIPGALLAAASLAGALGVSQQRSVSELCDLDGSRIDPLYQVTVVREGGESARFACVINACIWLARNNDEILAIWVIDEETGQKVSAVEAFYVVSSVVTTPHTRNRVHVFRRQETAEEHARTYAGRRIQNPLRIRPQAPAQRIVFQPPFNGKETQGVSPSFSKCLDQPTPPAFWRDGVICPLPANSLRRLRGFSKPPEKPPRAGA